MVELADRLLPALAAISDRALQARYLSNLANATGVREEDLRGRLRDGRATFAPASAMPLRERAPRPAPKAAEQEPAEDGQDALAPAHGPVAGATQAKQELLCLRLLYSFESLRTDGMLLEEDLFTDAANRYLFQVWRGSPDLARVPEQLDDTMAAQLSAVLHVAMPPFDGAQAARALADAVSRMRLRRLEERKRLMIGAVRDAEATVNRTRMVELAEAFFKGDDNLPEREAESEAALETLRDFQAAVEFHQMETAIRLGMTRQQT
jgi:DNA primase